MKSFLTKKAVLSVAALSGTVAVTAYYQKGFSITNTIKTITGCFYLANPSLPPVNEVNPVPPAPTIIKKIPQLNSTAIPKVLDKVDISLIPKDFYK